ncbi:MAG: helix-turn-helix domain-containing protein [Myxococcales bacterium]|nr:helix-turn-helix domain-containing protein [Myxococcales bacterium]
MDVKPTSSSHAASSHADRALGIEAPSGRAARARDVILPPDLFTASDLARFCQVDLKTIHNWSDKGQIPHFRTPGRHLRFRRLDVLDFLRRYGYAIPDILRATRPRLVVVDADAQTQATLKRTLQKRFEIISYVDPVDALVNLAQVQPDLLVVEVATEVGGLDGVHFLERLREVEATRHIRNLVFTKRPDVRARALAAGALSVHDKDDLAGLKTALEAISGVGNG